MNGKRYATRNFRTSHPCSKQLCTLFALYNFNQTSYIIYLRHQAYPSVSSVSCHSHSVGDKDRNDLLENLIRLKSSYSLFQSSTSHRYSWSLVFSVLAAEDQRLSFWRFRSSPRYCRC